MKNKKKALALSLAILILLLLSILYFKGYKKIQSIHDKNSAIALLQDFQFMKMDESTALLSTFIHQKTLLIIYFSSDCPYCEQSFRKIKEHESQFKKLDIIALSRQSLHQIYTFKEEIGFNESEFIHFLQDYEQSFYDTFLIQTIPAYFLYDKDGKLIKEYHGSKSMKEIMEWINTEL